MSLLNRWRVQQAEDTASVPEVLGHSDKSVTMVTDVYSHIFDADRKHLAKKVNDQVSLFKHLRKSKKQLPPPLWTMPQQRPCSCFKVLLNWPTHFYRWPNF